MEEFEVSFMVIETSSEERLLLFISNIAEEHVIINSSFQLNRLKSHEDKINCLQESVVKIPYVRD
jgi:hypothetical protein